MRPAPMTPIPTRFISLLHTPVRRGRPERSIPGHARWKTGAARPGQGAAKSKPGATAPGGAGGPARARAPQGPGSNPGAARLPDVADGCRTRGGRCRLRIWRIGFAISCSASAAATRPLGPEEMLAFGRSVDLQQLDLTGYRQFSDTRYARNSIYRNEHFELVVICWRANQASSIHDHGRSHCLYVVVEGEMQEELFELNDNGRPRRARTRSFGASEVTIAAPADVHRICNIGGGELVTIHVYSPPLDEAVTNYTPIPEYKSSSQPA